MAGAEGSMAAARGRKDVGERVWMCGGWEEEEELEGRRCEAMERRRVVGEDILSFFSGESNWE